MNRLKEDSYKDAAALIRMYKKYDDERFLTQAAFVLSTTNEYGVELSTVIAMSELDAVKVNHQNLMKLHEFKADGQKDPVPLKWWVSNLCELDNLLNHRNYNA